MLAVTPIYSNAIMSAMMDASVSTWYYARSSIGFYQFTSMFDPEVIHYKFV